MKFNDLGITPSILEAIGEQKYTDPTPIQIGAIPPLLEGRDFLGCAKTGTGKTAAFAIPILQRLAKQNHNTEAFNRVQALVLVPTRELAIQIGERFQAYGKYLELRTGVIYGGITPKRHIKVLKREPHILVATPGRLLDLFEQGYLDLSHVEMLVLDEADRMLDMGMIKDVKIILSKLPKKRQNMMFSATLPSEVMKIIREILKNPVSIKVKSKATKVPKIKQVLYYVDEPDKTSLLLHLLKDLSFESVLVFVRTKKKADKISKAINRQNIRSKAIHGDKNQSERLKALELFKKKEARVLVATDVAARGIDIDGLTHVINIDIPNVAESYIHRIGRTGRAGLTGTAISFCSNQEISFLKAIEKLQNQRIEVEKNNPYPMMHLIIKENRKNHE
ncbi:DEAD/DEAH box helicase [Petrocella sp. FN5]|uniref:DEAD/DEAH box helicase n=1 Tax=Petrocella sp. FN5 TaxID=3032002 RepID=UPI0023DB5723|nr:DEAD/DEAH box helicase [Petrocella sp. FN5]MDF1617826.1 DEAD/DEAH box helicase [Petrocella sp. FN5]